MYIQDIYLTSSLLLFDLKVFCELPNVKYKEFDITK